MKTPKPIKNLIEAFEKLPGIGPKTAQRLTFYLLHVPQEDLDTFSQSLQNLKIGTKLCSICKNVGETDPCEICDDAGRDRKIVAVVESPLDVLALERANFKGLYHVLHGVISPLNNIGPEDIYIRDLLKRLRSGTNVPKKVSELLQGDVTLWEPVSSTKIEEVILATNTNMEGESTSMYISRLITEAKEEIGEIRVTRIARGLPVGGDLEYADDVTLRRALEGRSNA